MKRDGEDESGEDEEQIPDYKEPNALEDVWLGIPGKVSIKVKGLDPDAEFQPGDHVVLTEVVSYDQNGEEGGEGSEDTSNEEMT